MRVTYDSNSDSAYIWLADGKPAERQSVYEAHTMGLIVLDFDESHRLIGIEILSARKALPPAVLELAEPGGPDESYWYEA